MKSFFNWLSTPYYFNPSIKFEIKMSLIFGFSVFIFLYVFQPFTLSTFKDFLLEYTLIIGLFSFLGALTTLVIPSLIFKDYFNEDNWTVGRNIFLILCGMLFTGSILWFYAGIYKESKGIEHLSFSIFLVYTFLVGAIPSFVIVFINEKEIREKREKKAEEINTQKRKKREEKEILFDKEIVIYSDNKKEQISFSVDNLIYITSQGNYASFFLKEDNNEIKEKILRVTLQKISIDLEKFSKIIRCHKSYIINSKYITDISGNARGYLLKCNYIPFDIPVSRSFSKNSIMQILTN